MIKKILLKIDLYMTRSILNSIQKRIIKDSKDYYNYHKEETEILKQLEKYK